MREIIQPEEILQDLVRIYRQNLNKKTRDMVSQKDRPRKLTEIPWNQTYLDAVNMQLEIDTHAGYKTFPDRLFRNRYPNEDNQHFKWRMDNFFSKTREPWNRACGTFARIWNEQNYTLKFSEDDPVFTDNTAEKYFRQEYPLYKDLVAYFKSVVTYAKLNDPNALLCIKPYELPVTEKSGEGEEAAEMIIDDTALLSPASFIYNSTNVVAFEDGVYAAILLDDKSVVYKDKTPVQEGLIFEFYDVNTIYHYTQTGQQKEYEFELTIYYTHNLGYLPAWKLRGIPVQSQDESLLYKSPLYDAVPSLDCALLNESTLQAVIAKNGYPRQWTYVQRCNSPSCKAGFLLGNDGTVSSLKCDNCKGTGYMQRVGPFNELQVEWPDSFSDNTPRPPFFGEADQKVDIMRFLSEMIDKDINNAFLGLNIDISTSSAKGSDTALGKMIDREELHTQILTFSNEIYTLLAQTIKAIGEMRYTDGNGGSRFSEPIINAPKNFAMRSESDLTEEIAMAKQSNLPHVLLFRQFREYTMLRFSNDAEWQACYDLMEQIDPILYQGEAEINAMLAAGRITRYDVCLHDNLHPFIRRAIRENENFLSMEFTRQVGILDVYTKEKMAGMV